MFFLVLGTDKPGMADVRLEVRPIHRAYLRNRRAGQWYAAGGGGRRYRRGL